MIKGLSLLLAFAMIVTASGQARKRVHYSRYTVKEYISIGGVRHGEYVWHSVGNFNGTNVFEFGGYDKNRRSDNWLTFYYDRYNSLMNIGRYEKDKREGLWKWFYPFPDTVRGMHLIKPKGILVTDNDWHGEMALVYDTIGQQVMAKGFYKNDLKFGSWNYYAPSGRLLHIYDHTNRQLLFNRSIETFDDPMIFLGGQFRFNLIFQATFKKEEERFDFPGVKEAIFAIHPLQDSTAYELVPPTKHQKFAERMQKLLGELPPDWVYTNPADKTRFLLIVRSTRRGQYRFGGGYVWYDVQLFFRKEKPEGM
jgi:hypothetical protein